MNNQVPNTDPDQAKCAIRRIRLRKELDRDLRKFMLVLVEMEDIPYHITRTALKLHERISSNA